MADCPFEVINSRVGYGDAHSRMWVVGLEEGCYRGDLATRLQLLAEQSSPFMRVLPFHGELMSRLPDGEARRKHERLLGNWRAVPTWANATTLFQLLLGERSDEPDSHILYTDLLPLPRPNHDEWPEEYSDTACYPALDYYNSDSYVRERGARLRALVAEGKPAVVVLDGKSEHRRWLDDHGHIGTEVRLGNRPHETANIWFGAETLWALINNLGGGQFVRWSPESLDALGRELKSRLAV